MNLIKNYIHYSADGYAAERKFCRETNGTITFTESMEIKMIPLAMDVDHKEFIIFKISRKKNPNLYLWVYLGREPHRIDKPSLWEKKRIINALEILRLPKWYTLDPIDVSGKYSDEIIHNAFIRLQEWSDEEIIVSLKEYGRWLNEDGASRHLNPDDRELSRVIKYAKENNKGILQFF